MSRQHCVIVVASDSDDDPVDYLADSSSSDDDLSSITSESSIAPTIASNAPSSSTSAPTTGDANADNDNDDDLHTLLAELSLRGANDRTVYRISDERGVRLTAQWYAQST